MIRKDLEVGSRYNRYSSHTSRTGTDPSHTSPVTPSPVSWSGVSFCQTITAGKAEEHRARAPSWRTWVTQPSPFLPRWEHTILDYDLHWGNRVDKRKISDTSQLTRSGRTKDVAFGEQKERTFRLTCEILQLLPYWSHFGSRQEGVRRHRHDPSLTCMKCREYKQLLYHHATCQQNRLRIYLPETSHTRQISPTSQPSLTTLQVDQPPNPPKPSPPPSPQ